jgi:hypothetical protein
MNWTMPIIRWSAPLSPAKHGIKARISIRNSRHSPIPLAALRRNRGQMMSSQNWYPQQASNGGTCCAGRRLWARWAGFRPARGGVGTKVASAPRLIRIGPI